MKILKRNYGHRNLIIFLLLSLIYLQAIASITYGKSLFSPESLRSFLAERYLILALTLITTYMIIGIKKYSKVALLICLIVIVGKIFILLSSSFNKLTLGLNFIYLLFAFYFFVSWELEVALASLNPHFSANDLEKEKRFKINATLKSSKENSAEVDVCVTNIDLESCFLLLPKNHKLEIKTSTPYLLESKFEGVVFKHTAYIVSRYDRGFGLIFKNSKPDRHSWPELYKVCLERGIVS